MVEIGGKPVLEHILFWLSKYGIYDVMINTGYKGEVIHNYLGTRCTYFFDPNIDLSVEQTIEIVKSWFKDDYMLVQNGDTLTDLDIDALVRSYKNRSIRFMDWDDQKVFAGTSILSPTYLFGGINDMKDVGVKCDWGDMGTLAGLKKARKRYG